LPGDWCLSGEGLICSVWSKGSAKSKKYGNWKYRKREKEIGRKKRKKSSGTQLKYR
jgi:hypothetical protein